MRKKKPIAGVKCEHRAESHIGSSVEVTSRETDAKTAISTVIACNAKKTCGLSEISIPDGLVLFRR